MRTGVRGPLESFEQLVTGSNLGSLELLDCRVKSRLELGRGENSGTGCTST